MHQAFLFAVDKQDAPVSGLFQDSEDLLYLFSLFMMSVSEFTPIGQNRNFVTK